MRAASLPAGLARFAPPGLDLSRVADLCSRMGEVVAGVRGVERYLYTGGGPLSPLWRQSLSIPHVRQWSPYVPIDIRCMSKEEVIDRLIGRSVHWNLIELQSSGNPQAKEQVLEDFALLAHFLRTTLLAFLSYYRIPADLFPAKEIDEVQRKGKKVFGELEAEIDLHISLRTQEEGDQMAGALLEAALHSRWDLGVFLLALRALAGSRALNWSHVVTLYEQGKTGREAKLMDKIQAAGGAVSYNAFFRLAMMDEEEGLYTGGYADQLIGREGEARFFVTSSEFKVFGVALLYFIRERWNELGCPDRFDLVEMGAGRGALAETILKGLLVLGRTNPPEWGGLKRAVRYSIVEASPRLAAIQRERLGSLPVRIHTGSAVDGPLPQVDTGLFLSNELLDMFPPRKVVNIGGRLLEVWIDGSAGFLQEVLHPAGDEACGFLWRHGIVLAPGAAFYIQPDIERWMANVSRHLRRGFVLTLDYGNLRKDILAKGGSGWARIFHGKTAVGSTFGPLGVLDKIVGARRGSSIAWNPLLDAPTSLRWPKDLTVDVDFTTLEEAAASEGFRRLGFVHEDDFLQAVLARNALLVPTFETDGFITGGEIRADLTHAEFRIQPHDNCYVSLLEK